MEKSSPFNIVTETLHLITISVIEYFYTSIDAWSRLNASLSSYAKPKYEGKEHQRNQKRGQTNLEYGVYVQLSIRLVSETNDSHQDQDIRCSRTT